MRLELALRPERHPEPELEDDVVDADFKEVKTKTDKLSAFIRRAENQNELNFLPGVVVS